MRSISITLSICFVLLDAIIASPLSQLDGIVLPSGAVLRDPKKREKRDASVDLSEDIDTASFEVPTILRVNDTRAGDVQVSFVQPQEGGGGGCRPTKKPISLTLMIDNIIPPGKSDKFLITNSSEIRGGGVVLKVNLVETRTTPSTTSSFDMGMCDSFERRLDKVETKTRKSALPENTKNNDSSDDDEEEDEGMEQKTIQEVLKRILTGGNNSPDEPITLVVKPPSVSHGKSGKPRGSSHKLTLKSPNPPETAEGLSKLVDQLSTNLPKSKLLSLLSNLVNKISDEHV